MSDTRTAGRHPRDGQQPYDPELASLHAQRGAPSLGSFRIADLQARRDLERSDESGWRAAHPHVTRRELSVERDGGTLELSLFRRESTGDAHAIVPVIYFIHGGGMMVGDRLTGIALPLRLVESLDVACVSVEYRLAPEHPHPTPVEDCYAGLVWLAGNAATLGLDAERIVVCGVSAGGGLAAATVLLARDRGGPRLLGQALVCPMLDDRNNAPSTHQFADNEFWDRDSNATGWAALLGDLPGADNVSDYAAPARATDVGGLPPTFLDVGSAELFRDEGVEYASRLLAAGVEVELHVWRGGFHEFDALYPEATISRTAVATRTDWFRRLLGVD
jgi:acetyl esterase/lipase